MSSKKGKYPKYPKLNPRPRHACVYLSPFGFSSQLNLERPQDHHFHNSTNVSQQLQYNYIPTQWICILFITLFNVSMGRVPSAFTDRPMLTTITIRMQSTIPYKQSSHVSGGYSPVQFSPAFSRSPAGAVDCGRVTTHSHRHRHLLSYSEQTT